VLRFAFASTRREHFLRNEYTTHTIQQRSATQHNTTLIHFTDVRCIMMILRFIFFQLIISTTMGIGMCFVMLLL
jgi:hypothetical protein